MAVAIKKVVPQSVQSEKECLILDVRTGAEHATTALQREHIHVPLDQLQAGEFMRERNLDGSTPLYILCGAGVRSVQAAEAFAKAGLQNVHVIEGGINACKAAGLPLRTRSHMSLERQVRIVIGSLVLIGSMFGALVHPGFYGLVAAIGAGLLLSGITGWCGMAMMLAKAPWNKSGSACCR